MLLFCFCDEQMTPDDRFIIDKHPLYSNVVIATGFSGRILTKQNKSQRVSSA